MPPADAERQRFAKNNAERRVGRDLMVGDAMPPAGEPPLADHAAHGLVVGAGPVPRTENHRRPGLRILEPRLAGPARLTSAGSIM